MNSTFSLYISIYPYCSKTSMSQFLKWYLTEGLPIWGEGKDYGV
jgi:hypothetical protein